MANAFPCPNPTCTHAFPADTVKGAATLVCPRCGTRFQFRASEIAAPQTAPANNPAAKIQTVPARAVPVTPALPVTPAMEANLTPFALPTDPAPLVARRPVRARKSGVGWIAVLVLLLAVVVGAVGVVWVLKHAGDGEDAAGSLKSEFNFEFAYPSKEWKQDKKVRLALGANLALSRSEPSAWLAVFAHDYKTRSPRDAESHDQLLTWLERYFKGVEWEPKPDGKLDGLPAKHVEFQGEVDNVLMNGECVRLTRRGYGYWLVTWAPAERRDMAAEEWPSVHAGFHFLTGRDGWQEKKPEQITVQGEKAAYRLAYTKGVWEKQPVDGFDPNADLLLRGFDPKEENKIASTAGTVTMLMLPRGEGDLKSAATAARAYFLEKQKEAGYPDSRVEVVADKHGPADGPADIGAARGHLARLRVRNSESRELYVELATVVLPDGVLVMQSECLWPRRDYWRQEFAPLRATLRVGKGK